MNLNKETIHRLFSLGRFQFLIGGFLLYNVGALLALVGGDGFSVFHYLFGYAIMLPAHLSLSYSNNYFDVEVDKHTTPSFIAGGSKILIEHPELRKITLYISLALIAFSLFLAAVFIFLVKESWLLFVFVLAGNLLGLFYTAPPLKLSYRGFGEIVNVVSIGLLMPGMGYWIMSGGLDLFFLVFAAPMFFYGLKFIILIEIPDMEGDQIGGKNTLIAKKGRSFGFSVVVVSLVLASSYYVAISLLGLYHDRLDYRIVSLISLIPLFAAIRGWMGRPFTKTTGSKTAARTIYSLYALIMLILVYFLVLILVL